MFCQEDEYENGDDEGGDGEDQDDYDYIYEEDDDIPVQPGKLEREVSESHFDVPVGDCSIHEYIEIAPLMEKLVLEVSMLLGVHRNIAELLLRHTKWDQTLVAEKYYNNPNGFLVAAGVELEDGETKSEMATQCLICYDNIDAGCGRSLKCGHTFCRDCYCGYLENLVSDGPSCITMTCPSFKCPLKISTDTMRSICDSEVSEKYYKYVVRDFIDSSTFMHWCPAPNCGLIALGVGITDIVCRCSFPYCASCGQESHRPATCKEVSQWILKNTNESENSSWILVNTKACPKCSRRIEKNKGCNHMTCSICRYEFCWICMSDWKNHNGNSYQCNQYVDDAQTMNELRNVKQRLDRYLHYFSRYHTHDQSLKHAIRLRNTLLQDHGSKHCDILDRDSLLKAASLVVACRRALKNSYVVGYYDLHSKTAGELYELQQQMLEFNTETLSGLTEKEGLTIADREYITNLSTVTNKFLEFMMKYHHDDEDDMNTSNTSNTNTSNAATTADAV